MTMMEVKWWLWKRNGDDGGEVIIMEVKWWQNNDHRGEMMIVEEVKWCEMMSMETKKGETNTNCKKKKSEIYKNKIIKWTRIITLKK